MKYRHLNIWLVFAFCCMALQLVPGEQKVWAATVAMEEGETSAAATLSLRLSVGDMFRLKHVGTVPGGSFLSVTSHNMTGETLLAVVNEDSAGIYTLYGQSVIRGKGADGDDIERWTVYSYKIDRKGKVVSFPLRDWIFHANNAQALDFSSGAIVPFSLPGGECAADKEWTADIAPPTNIAVASTATARTKLVSDKGIVDINLDVDVHGGKQGYGAHVDMQFDVSRGLPLAWEGTNQFTLYLYTESASPVIVTSSFHTRVQSPEKLAKSELEALADIAPKLMQIQELASFDNQERPRADAMAADLYREHVANAWLRGLDSILQANRPAARANRGERDEKRD